MQSSKTFKDFYSSESGSLQFNFAESPDITAVECSDQTGCTCGNLKVYQLVSKYYVACAFDNKMCFAVRKYKIEP